MRLILASASPVRAEMLRHAGVEFDIMPADVDEEALKRSLASSPSSVIAEALAELKALRVSTKYPDAFVIGADQILDFEGEIVSKSKNLAEAGALLRRLRGRAHELVTAAVVAKNGVVLWRHVGKASLLMRAFGDQFLKSYLAAEGESLLAGVGCYRLEGRGSQLFERIEGDHFGILGLPLLPLLAALREHCILPA
ncbi:MAG TPA: nucleoside triphosphate pyrophosphatase [Rhizomicrobium sp.]|nr:nucleoside triphosphate pyrophosphatase [Rhizomicrobium sp.]